MKKPREKISKLRWCVRWQGGTLELFAFKRLALYEMEFHSYNKAILFRCKIEEITK